MTDCLIFNPDCPNPDLLTESFTYFLGALWHENGNMEKAPLGSLDYDIANYADTGPARRGIMGFRGIGKTDGTTCAYAAYRLLKNPQIRIKVVSKSNGKAVDMIGQVRQWFNTIWFLQHLQPVGDGRDNDVSIDVGPAELTKTPSLQAFGIEGMITGGRAHLFIADDIETPENTKTADAREKLLRKTSEFVRVASYADTETGRSEGEVLVIGTPHHEESVYDALIEKGYEFRQWPIMLPHRSGDYAIGKLTAPAPYIVESLEKYEAEKGGPIQHTDIVPTVPQRFGVDDILVRMSSGAIEFAMQEMMISRAVSGIQAIRLRDLIVPDFDFRDGIVPSWIKWGMSNHDGSTAREDIERVGFGGDRLHKQIDTAPRDHWAKMQDIRMRVDPSGGGSDETAYAIGGSYGGVVWVMAVSGFGGAYSQERGDSDTVFQKLALVARDLGVKRIVVESNFAGNLFADQLRVVTQGLWTKPGDKQWPQYPDGWKCSVEDQRVSSGAASKPSRIISSLSSVMSMHRLVIHEDAIKPTEGLNRKYELQYQLSAIRSNGGIQHDDRVEVLADLVSDFSSYLRSDPEAVAEMMRENLLAEQDKWVDERFGAKKKAPSKMIGRYGW